MVNALSNSGPSVPLNSIIITDSLRERPARAQDDAAINNALVNLSQVVANHPERVLQELADSALVLCRAHSTGISLLEEDGGATIFRWRAVAGEYAPYYLGTMPREFSPCGTVLDSDSTLLMRLPERYYTYMVEVTPAVSEVLLVPFHVNGESVGTIWAISHDQERQFDSEDLRALSTLGEFAAVAYQLVSSLNSLKRTRGDLEASNRELVQRNADLTASVRERERAEALLKSANNELEQFALAASHDLREPLRTVGAFSQLLERHLQGKLDQAGHDLLQKIIGGASSMGSMLENLLDYARAGLSSPHAYLSTEDVFEAALENLRGMTNDVDMAIERDPLPQLEGDRTQLILLFQNLLANAIKYRHPDRQLQIQVAVDRQDKMWLISVKDNGQGFAQEFSQQIFARFARLHDSSIPGRGMGLSLCRKIVERHGGTIWAKSQPNIGSEFHFTLPASD